MAEDYLLGKASFPFCLSTVEVLGLVRIEMFTWKRGGRGEVGKIA
jgi:hypothetical protein